MVVRANLYYKRGRNMYWWYVEFLPGKFCQLAVAHTPQIAAQLVLAEAGVISAPECEVRVLQLGWWNENDEEPPFVPNSPFLLKQEYIMEDDS